MDRLNNYPSHAATCAGYTNSNHLFTFMIYGLFPVIPANAGIHIKQRNPL
jgi:hypothetical protein